MTSAGRTSVLLGVGVPRGGSTYLAQLLALHDDVVAPTSVKETRFLDMHWDRGERWFDELYRPGPGSVLLDFSPQYLYDESALERAVAWSRVERVVVTLRAPWDRAWSEHQHLCRMEGSRRSFGESVKWHPEVIERGSYHRYVERWSGAFGDRMEVMLSEEVSEAGVSAVAASFEALGLPPLDPDVASRAIDRNEGFTPRSRRIYGLGMAVKQSVRRAGFTQPVRVMRWVGGSAVVRSRRPPAAMPASLRQELVAHYRPSVLELESYLGRPTGWLDEG